MKRIVSCVLMVVLMLGLNLTLTGCKSKVVPPGTVVIVLTAGGDSTVYSQGSYTAYGRDRVYFVDTKIKAFSDKLDILCKDNINMRVDFKWVGSFDVNDKALKIIKEKVPSTPVDNGDISGFQLSLDQFYVTAMKDILASSVRGVVSDYVTDAVQEKQGDIEKQVKERVVARYLELGYPVKTTDVLITNIDYPEEVTTQRKAIKNAQLEDEKQAALAKAAIKQAERAAGIAREEGKAKIETARAEAAANEIKTASLTPAIIQMRQWEVLEKIGGLDGDLIILPYEAFGNSGFANTAMTTKAIKQGPTKVDNKTEGNQDK